MRFINRKYIIISVLVIAVIIGTALALIPTNVNQDDTISTITIEINKTLTITNTTTFTITTTSINKSIVTTTLPPNIVTVTSTTTTIIQPQGTTIINYILGDNSTTTITRTLTTNITLTTTKDWHISGAKISQPSLVGSITFTFTNYDRLLQVGSYISFSADYITVVNAVMNENSISDAITPVITGNIDIDGKLYQYSMFVYRDAVTDDLKYVIIAAHYYPDFIRTYYVLYKTSGPSTIAEMKAYLGTFKIGI